MGSSEAVVVLQSCVKLEWGTKSLSRLTSHWIQAVLGGAATFVEAVILSWGNSQKGILAESCYPTIFPAVGNQFFIPEVGTEQLRTVNMTKDKLEQHMWATLLTLTVVGGLNEDRIIVWMGAMKIHFLYLQQYNSYTSQYYRSGLRDSSRESVKGSFLESGWSCCQWTFTSSYT
jgi:hypothetical protein